MVKAEYGRVFCAVERRSRRACLVITHTSKRKAFDFDAPAGCIRSGTGVVLNQYTLRK